MKHYIIVKYKEDVQNKAELLERIRRLYADVARIPGVLGAQVYPNCTARDNRYDLMIVVDMEKEALKNWDDSETHHTWKKDFGPYLAAKAIFDREE